MLRCLSAPFLTTLHGRVDLGRAPLSGRISAFGRMVATKRVVHVTDLSAEQSYFERAPEAVTAVELGNIRTIVFVPVLKEDELIGGIAGASATDLSWRPWPHAPGPCRGAGWGEGSDESRGSTPCKAKSLNPSLVNRPCNDQKRRMEKGFVKSWLSSVVGVAVSMWATRLRCPSCPQRCCMPAGVPPPRPHLRQEKSRLRLRASAECFVAPGATHESACLPQPA